MLDGVARRRRQVVFPQRVDQRVDGDDATAAKREQREQALALAAAHVRRPSAGEDLERAEQPDFERLVHARRESACTHQSRTLLRAWTGGETRAFVDPLAGGSGIALFAHIGGFVFGWIVARNLLETERRRTESAARHSALTPL